jgi:hypothetical protein
MILSILKLSTITGVLLLGMLVSLQSNDARAASASLKFTARAGILKLGKVSIAIDTNSQGFNFRLGGRSAGILGLVDWNASIQSKGTFTASGPRPSNYSAQVTRKGRPRTTTINFAGSTPTYVVSPNKVSNATEQLNPGYLPGTVDPATAIMQATIILNKTGRCGGDTTMFDGRSVVRMQLRDKGTQRISVPAFKGTARKCILYPTPLTGRVMRPKTKKNIKPATVWFGQLGPKREYIPVKIATSAKGVSISLTLTKAKIR